jgi:hypothetical protein
MIKLADEPEPCLNGLCRSPVACAAFGYCRQRNFDADGRPNLPSAEQAEAWRDLAAQRKAE